MNITKRSVLTSVVSLAGACNMLTAEVPSYGVEVVATFAVTTTVEGASDSGHIVGYQVLGGVLQPYIATLDDGLAQLPLPSGYISGAAFDVNDAGVVVGTVSTSTLPTDFGEPAIWIPDGSGGYEVIIPEQFDVLPSPIGGDLAITGGQAVAINNNGTIVGWSRFQGFQGGPTTLFSIDESPVDLGAQGFEATVRDINNNDVLVGGGLTFDLATQSVTELGVPDPVGTVSFTNVIGYAINDSSEVVAAARRATSGNDIWLTYVHDGDWSPLNPSQLPTRFVGFYDNNNLGDVSATGGVYFAPEDTLVNGYNALLVPEDQGWDVSLGFIGNDRRVYTTAFDLAANTSAIVVLVPVADACPADLTGDGDLDFFDISAFISAFGAGDPSADFDGNGSIDFFDVSDFISAFGAGCP